MILETTKSDLETSPPHNLGGYIGVFIDSSEYKTVATIKEYINKIFPSIPQIIIAPTTEKIVCEELGSDITAHISKNTPNVEEITAKYVDALIAEAESDEHSQVNCKNKLIDIDSLVADIYNEFSTTVEENTYDSKIKPYITLLCENSIIDGGIVTYNDISEADTTRIISTTNNIENEIDENIIPTTEIDGPTQAVEQPSQRDISLISHEQDTDCVFNTEEHYNTHIITPLALAEENASGNLHLLKQTQTFGGIDNRTKTIITIISHIISQELRAISAEDKLLQKLEILQKFRYIISHDLISPLSTAKGRTEIAKHEMDNPHVERAYNAIERMEKMIDSTERLLSAGERINIDEKIQMEETCKAAWEIIDVSEAELVVENDFGLYADKEQLKTILENLFKNSIEHGGRDVTIRVYKQTPIKTSTRSDPNSTFSFVIEDDGEGIPEDIKGEIFEKKKTTKQNEKVSGFGLSIVKSSVEAHDWEIDVGYSSKGAKFVFSNVR